MRTAPTRQTTPSMRAAQMLTLLALAGIPLVDAAGEPLVHMGLGYIAILLEPDQTDMMSADVTFYGLESNSVAGFIEADAANPDKSVTYFSGRTDPDVNVRVITAQNGEQTIRVTREKPSYDAGDNAFYVHDPFYFIFFAAGDVQRIEVDVVEGTLAGSTSGPEAYALWAEDFRNDTLGVAAHVPGAFGAGARSHARAELDIPRPFYGDFYYPLANLNSQGLGEAYVTHDGATQACSCSFKPGTTTPGEYVFEIDGIGDDRLLFWGIAPDLPTYTP